MKKYLHKLAPSLILVIGTLLIAPGVSAHTSVLAAQSSSSNFVSGQPGVSASQAANAARGKVGGRVISVKPKKGGQGYRVRMLVEGGRVVTVNVDSKGRVKK